METGTDSGKRHYKKIWLGLIPLIGGMIGIWLLYEGITRYKDRRLIIIASAMIVFTVGLYSSLYYWQNYSKSYREVVAQFCQPELNDLVTSIEYFKKERKRYPDNLTQVLDNDKYARIYDPISQEGDKNERLFYYTKTSDSTYILYSAGIDRIPNNADDIFPSKENFDSIHFGLRRPLLFNNN